jgi:aminopeptidase
MDNTARFAGQPIRSSPVVSEDRLARYAEVLVNVGLRIQPGDRLLVRSGMHAAPLTRHVVRHAYRAGAVNVDVLWIDDDLDRSRFADGTVDADSELPFDTVVMSRAADRGDSFLRIGGEAPDRMADVDVGRLGVFMDGFNDATAGFFQKMMSLGFIWTGAAAPSPGWAKLVFPDLSPEQSVDRLWDAVLATCRVDEADPIASWESHLDQLDARKEFLNGQAFKALRYEGPGTDLVVGLPEVHRWNHTGEGHGGRRIVANIPTEEVSTSPHRNRADGVIRATKPLPYRGRVIDGFEFRLKDGAVVEAHANQGQEDLDRILATDEGATRLGEVALVPLSSLVASQNLIWYQTLFDENEASHVALGNAYPMGIRDGLDMTPERLSEAGNNSSSIHVDFVVGSPELSIYGIGGDGAEVPLIEEGEWAFEV